MRARAPGGWWRRNGPPGWPAAGLLLIVAAVALIAKGCRNGQQSAWSRTPATRDLPQLFQVAQPILENPAATRARYILLAAGRPSPDGKWRLNWSPGNNRVAAELTPVNGSQLGPKTRQSVPKRGFWATASNAIWLPDSKGWIGVAAGDRSLFVVEQYLNSTAARFKPIGYPRWTVAWPDLMPSDLLGFVAPGRVLAFVHQDGYARPRDNRRRVPFYQFSVGPGPARLREYSIILPAGMDHQPPVLSPSGRWLAWMLEETPQSRGSSQELTRRVVLAVSDPEGRNWTYLADLSRTHPSDRLEAPFLFEWTPDGTALVFGYANQRWRFPIPEALTH